MNLDERGAHPVPHSHIASGFLRQRWLYLEVTRGIGLHAFIGVAGVENTRLRPSGDSLGCKIERGRCPPLVVVRSARSGVTGSSTSSRTRALNGTRCVVPPGNPNLQSRPSFPR